MSFILFFCNAINCAKEANIPCEKCFLVQYCSPQCRDMHWSVHRWHCECRYSDPSWRPRWDRENRKPIFSEKLDEKPKYQRYHGKTLWGTTPAVDILRLESNEGLGHNEDLKLLFYCCGDLRNVMMTVNAIPDDYTGKFKIVISDKDFDIVGRNFLILAYLIAETNVTLATENTIHLWYSAFVPESADTRIRQILNRDVEGLLARIADSSDEEMYWHS
ncbi:hypothetical protein AAE478_010451 [Parahypoxylon ruwenzoriense]